MSDLKKAAEGFLEGFTGGGLFVRSVRADRPNGVFAPSADRKRAEMLLDELESLLLVQDRNEIDAVWASRDDQEAVSVRLLLQRVRSVVTSAPAK